MQENTLWQHVQTLQPEIQTHLKVYSHYYRQERWYILHDTSSGQYLRFNERAYEVIGRFDGKQTLVEILSHANEKYYDAPISEDEVVSLLAQLNAAEVLKVGLPVDVQDIFHHYKSQKRKQKQRTLMNPLSIKIPLLNPERILHALSPLARMIFTPLGLSVWVFTLALALIFAISNAPALLSDIQALSLSPSQLMMFWFIYPLLKAWHELGHGLALKIWDGEVPEAGINILLLMPVPYVDATSSLAFQNKWRRITVGAAGIIFELYIASFCLFLWMLVEPGIVKEICLNVMILATLSTLLFNGNPLLRYDGYFILEDYLEIPNLASRAKRYYYYLIQKYLLNMPEAFSPVTAFGEKKWFLLYGFFSPLYRLVILFGIAIYLSGSFFFVGVALSLWAVLMQVIIPLAKGLSFLFFDKSSAYHRKQSFYVLTAFSLSILLILSIPLPSTTYTQGIISTLADAQIKANAEGFVSKVHIPSGSHVKKGDLLIELYNPELEAKHTILKAKLQEIEAKIGEQQLLSRVQTQIYKDDLHSIENELKLLSSKLQGLKMYAKSDGLFILAEDKNYKGNFIEQGEVPAYVIHPKKLIIKALVTQEDIGLMQEHETSAQVALNDIKHHIVSTQIIHETPQAIRELPSQALSVKEGGRFLTDPNDSRGLSLKSPMFLLELHLPKDSRFEYINSRVDVRLEYGHIPLAKQLLRALNQLFLRHFY